MYHIKGKKTRWLRVLNPPSNILNHEGHEEEKEEKKLRVLRVFVVKLLFLIWRWI
jgi:hypothetical protein